LIFSVYYAAAIVLLAAERWWPRSRPVRTPRRSANLWIAAIVISYAIQVALLRTIAASGSWPIPVVRWASGHDGVVATLLALGAAQTYALLALSRACAAWRPIAIGGAIMLAVSLAAPVLGNADLYAYVGNGLLARQAYTPPHHAFSGDFAAINHFWGVPVPPMTYGPLWPSIVRVATFVLPALVWKMVALRALGALMLVVLTLLLRAYGVPARILSLVALNPAMHLQFVLNAHNDLLPIALSVAAALVATEWTAVAVGLVTVAASIKAPYALLALPVFARMRSPSARSIAVVATLVFSAALSWFAGGAPYLAAIARYGSQARPATVLHALAAIAAIALVVAGVVSIRRIVKGVWLVPMLGVYVAPWYAIWSLPYALASRRALTYLLVMFPFASMLVEPALARAWKLFIVVPLAVALAVYRGVQRGPSYKKRAALASTAINRRVRP
jgi:hypothetical protein